MRSRWGDLNTRDRRALVLGAVIIAAALVGFRGVPAWVAWRSGSYLSAAELGAELRVSRAELEAFPASMDTLQVRLDRFRSLNLSLVVGRNEDELKASVQRILEDGVRRAGLRIEGIELNVQSSQAAAFRRVVARVRATGDVTGLAMLLAELKSGPRLLALRHLGVSASDVAAPAEQTEHLALRFTIEALAMLRHDDEDAAYRAESGG